MPIEKFKQELHRSVDILRQQTGKVVLGHRAADFSISGRSLHLLESLVEEGLVYDSSIFPIRHPRYGVPGAPREAHLIRSASKATLVEFPMATVRFGRLILPAAGGGYLRLFPYWWTRIAMNRRQREGAMATCYMHPYELDTAELEEIPYDVPLKLRWSQFTNRRSVRKKLRRLLREFRFVTMAEAYGHLASRLSVALDLGKRPIAYNET
jgi:polysaccharide deacetylase family protein (PEP-CTERM system associated)